MKKTSKLLLACLLTSQAFVGKPYIEKTTDTTQFVNEVTYNEVELNNDDFFKKEFDSYHRVDKDDGFKFNLSKKYSTSSLTEIDFVNTSNAYVNVRYDIEFFELEGRITLDIYTINSGEKKNFVEQIEGLVVPNDRNEIDVLFAKGDETIFLSELISETTVDNVGFWDSIWNWFSTSFIKVVVKGLKTLCEVAVKCVGLEKCARILDMSKDSNGIYHAEFDCWQSIFGYNKFYDFVFDLATEMGREQIQFYDENQDGKYDYCLWAWKGDYWELGYGAELGIYKRFGNSEIWNVDKGLAIDMKMQLEYRPSLISKSRKTIIEWDPASHKDYSSKNWWITAFNPDFKKIKGELQHKDLLRASYDVRLVTKSKSVTFDNSLKKEFEKRNEILKSQNRKYWTKKSNDWFYFTF